MRSLFFILCIFDGFYVVSEWSNQLFKSEGIPFSAPIIQGDVAKSLKQICLFCLDLLDFFLIVVKDSSIPVAVV